MKPAYGKQNDCLHLPNIHYTFDTLLNKSIYEEFD